jgi:uncharacterized tellurite resistance protein B-like protein
MFLAQLTRPQRQAFLSLARELVEADGVMTLGEVIATTDLARELGLDDGSPVLPFVEAAARFETRPSRMVALLELMALAHSDGTVAAAENAAIRRLGLVWRVDTHELRTIESWVLEHRRLLHEARQLIRGERS